MKRFAIKAVVDIVWVVAIILCSRVFENSVVSFGISIGSLLVVKWVADAVLVKVLRPKALPAEPSPKPLIGSGFGP